MKAVIRLIIAAAAVSVCLLVFGFVLFGTIATRASEDALLRADGIVVLTGGGARISAGASLLNQGRAKRLLISGVNKTTRRSDLLRLSGLKSPMFDCCVDIGYAALNTIGNADETRKWAEKQKFKSIIVVTSGYHMPRSLMELDRALPDTELIPYSVMPKSLRRQQWWLHATTMRVLLAEYIKLLPAAARYAASRITGGWVTDSVATTPESTRTKI